MAIHLLKNQRRANHLWGMSPRTLRVSYLYGSHHGKYLWAEQMRDESVWKYFHNVNSHVYSRAYGQSLELINFHHLKKEKKVIQPIKDIS